jgi:SAM-dependent methyltransferase
MAKGSVVRKLVAPQGEPEPAPPLKLDIGCGKNIPNGWVGIDEVDYGQKHVADVRKGIPYPDNSVDEARSSHFVEHLTGPERIKFFNELWRVMKPNATALIITPNWSHACAYGDPTHQWPPMSQWWPLYLHKEWRATNAPYVEYTCHFDHVIAGSWDQSIEGRNLEYRQYAMQNLVNGWRDLIVTLTCKKE